MRFYEFASASNNDAEDLLPILRIIKAQSTDRGSSGKISYDALLGLADNDKISLGGRDSDKAEMLAALKAAVPALGALIKSSDSDGTAELDQPNEPSEVQPNAKGPSIDQMAKGNLELSPKI